ncbi:MAG: U32 family peptidase [Clostridia bacterium]|nr:U32 family peptidase [Clostridia bacterium]
MSDLLTLPLPELLCPAGSPEALDAAIEGGADAVYLGGACFNARMNAHNFGGDALRSAVLRAHAYGVKVYMTLNTLVTDRELPALVEAAREAAEGGVDALITADLGAAAAIHRALPTMELHASTQMSGHGASAARLLRSLGFTRMVIARETSEKDLAYTVEHSPLEIEAFIHGALCVSHSGQCLFSSLVGGRSGNRGECAQPCRLPYTVGGKTAYPLSLKDLSLAAHVPALIASGVRSLKIEGRMKSPEYVRDTTSIWRRLLDERRAATPAEMRALAEIFSRGGFTDGYFCGQIDRRMLGVRSQDDKEISRTLEPFRGLTRKIPLDFFATLRRDEPITLTLSDGANAVTVTGGCPAVAINAPLTRETVARNLSKLGGTVYTQRTLELELDEGLMLPISQLNDLRRRAIAEWEAHAHATQTHEYHTFSPRTSPKERTALRSACFYNAAQITSRARAYFDRIYLPLDQARADCDGVLLPPVIFDSDRAEVEQMLADAHRIGIRYALVGNLGHVEYATRAGLIPVGDFRLNVTNSETVCQLEALGLSSVILSPELTLPQARDVHGDTALIVYGRIPLMTLEKCIGREISDCRTCGKNAVTLKDRRGFVFPVLREWKHRSLICNSLPTCMSDRTDALSRARITAQHFLFTTETPREVDGVIEAFEHGKALNGSVRRI